MEGKCVLEPLAYVRTPVLHKEVLTEGFHTSLTCLVLLSLLENYSNKGGIILHAICINQSHTVLEHYFI